MDIGGVLYHVSMRALPVLLAITLHEAAHGFAAWKLGDDTAWRLGRVSINPLRHIDPVGTVLLPTVMYVTNAPFLFGWAKPVPVVFGRLRDPRFGMVWVALAGPGINIVLALVSAWLLTFVWMLPDTLRPWCIGALLSSVEMNVVLAVFNLIPLLPLDGGRVVAGLLPPALAIRFAGLERVSMLLLLLAFLVLPVLGEATGFSFDVFSSLLSPVISGVANGVCGLFGVQTRFGGF